MDDVSTHLLNCQCEACKEAFPKERFEPIWSFPKPNDTARKVEAKLPLGQKGARYTVYVWVDESDKLIHDWPGLPGTARARLDIDWTRIGGPQVTGTRDPILMTLAHPVPLRRRFVEKVNARMMVTLGLVPMESSDLIPCEIHGFGAPALACLHVLEPGPLPIVALYDVDGDYPDLMCEACLQRYLHKEFSSLRTVCSVCQQHHAYRHNLSGFTWYGRKPEDGQGLLPIMSLS